MEELLKKGLEEIKAQVKTSVDNSADEIKSLNEKLTQFELDLKSAKESGVSMKLINEMQAQMDELDVKSQSNSGRTELKTKSLVQAFGELTEGIVEDIKSQGSNFSSTYEMKAVGNISFGNFGAGAYDMIASQTLPGVDSNLADFYFRNIFASADTNSEIIQYLKYTGGEGQAAIWDERAGTLVDKPLVDMDFVKASENVVWIAALANVHRGMLMDAPFLSTFVPQELTYGERGLLVAENAYIIAKLQANSTAYNNTSGLTNAMEKIYDAAFGQMKGYRKLPTHILMNHRDELKYIAFNKASGSGEYDLPVGSVTVVDGKLRIGGVQVIGTPDVAQGKFYVIDNRVGTFFNRLSPEVEVSTEHKDNFSKNMATFRAEERVALMIKDNKGVIYGDLNATTTTTL